MLLLDCVGELRGVCRLFSMMTSHYFIFYIIAILVSLVIHEFSHAACAVLLGDPTPRIQGRLSLNPLVHFEPIGLIMMLIAPVGWAKPVMCDTSRLRHPRVGMAIIAAAGPASNLLLACICFLSLRLLLPYGSNGFLTNLCLYGALINVNLMVFNLIPIPPLDGSRIALPFIWGRVVRWYHWLEVYGSFIILGLVIVLNGIVLQPLFAGMQMWMASWFQLQMPW